MDVTPTAIAAVLIITPRIFGDERGAFLETYNKQRYVEAGINADFVQDNLSLSQKNTLRGLHYQRPPFAQAKLVSVARGRVLDVAVDIRRGSPTYGKHVMVELDGEKRQQLWIPEGFAHGFLTLEDDTLFSYKTTNYYAPEHDHGILWNDTDLAIEWPVADPVLSEKDTQQPHFNAIEEHFTYSA